MKQVGFEPGVKERGIMDEQSGETEEEEVSRYISPISTEVSWVYLHGIWRTRSSRRHNQL